MNLPRAAQALIVGGGPAGASAAFFLASHGIDVTIVDKASFPRAKPCAEYLSPECSRILDAMGVLDRVENSGAAQLCGMIVRAPNGFEIRGRFAAGHGFHGYRDRGLALRRKILDSLLLERTREVGVRILEHARVVSLSRRNRGFEVSVLIDGKLHEMSADLLIGADGLRSVVARQLDLSKRARWPKRIAFVAHWRGVRDVGTHGEMHVHRDGYVGLADVGDGITNVALVVPAARARAASGDVSAFLQKWIADKPQLVPRFENAEQVSQVFATGPFASHAKAAYAADAALVGDAADFFDPFTGEGIYAALRGGELLAPFAAEAARASSQNAALRALSGYDRARTRVFGGKWRVEKLIGTAVGFPSLMNTAARSLSRRSDIADLLVGVAGDFVPPSEVLRFGVLWRLLVPPFRPRSILP